MAGKKLEEMMKQIGAHQKCVQRETAQQCKQFYYAIIPLHKNKQLRAFASKQEKGFSIYRQIDDLGEFGNKLCYTGEGFTKATSENSCLYSTHRPLVPFEIKNGKLCADGLELLYWFPNLTVESVESALEKSLQQLEIYKSMNR